MADRPDIGVILLQLGTPSAPTTAALRRYLREFLSDPRVIDLPRALWLPILHLIVLRTRPRKSADLYQQVWTPAGSPLAVTTAAQAAALQETLTNTRKTPIRVVVGMRYGEPSIASALATLTAEGVRRILAFPMYPQYAGATTGSSLERLYLEAGRLPIVPSIRIVPPYFTDAHYIDALATITRRTLGRLEQPVDRIVVSFHGLPKRYVDEGDPYADQCRATVATLTQSLGPAPPLSLTFQSQFGREEWLTPYTDVTLGELGRTGARIAVMCPGFTADCLETIEEIGLRGAKQFRATGGESFLRIECLNEDPAWIAGMAALATRELSGWI